MLQKASSIDNIDNNSSNNDGSPTPPYCTLDRVLIHPSSAAAQSITEYCAVPGNDYVFQSESVIHQANSLYTCNLPTLVHCPVKEDVVHEKRNEQVAKHESRVEMTEVSDKQSEFNERCPSISRDPDSTTSDSSNDDQTEKPALEIINNQSAYFPPENVSLPTYWHLYRINISNNDDLGFVVPCELIKLPRFYLYENDDKLTVQIVYVGLINYKQCENQFENFCRYLFEQAFDDMNTGLESILKFDIERSTFKLLPCLLKKSGDIDCQRMQTICDRKNKLIQNPSELNDNELYYPSHLPKKQYYMNISAVSPPKQASDPWKYKKPLNTIKSYADYYEYMIDGIQIQRDFPMAAMKRIEKPSLDYLKESSSTTNRGSNTSSTKPDYYPIEVFRYAPLNQTDLRLIYKLPSILVRILQLYYIEQWRKLLADNIQCYSLLDVDQMPIVTFDDCLTTILSSTQSSVLPLASLHYDLLSENNYKHQPSPGLLFQSITRPSAVEKTNMENLKILGDCFLKLAMSMSFYHQYPSDGAGKLTPKKDKQVSNENLHRLAMKKELKNYLYINKLIYGGTEANWIPPGFTVDEENTERYTKQKTKWKAFADMIEALIGAFLISTDYITTIKFMKWLGLDVIPIDEQNQVMKTPSVLCPGLSHTMDDINIRIEEFFSNQPFAEIEKEINYVFKNKAYLITAFTHPSYYNNHLTQCYERLEYLGDAVLDFLVIRYVFIEHYQHVTPRRVTDIGQDLSNNGRLAYILVCCDLHTKILHSSSGLSNQIASYLGDETLFSTNQSIEDKLSKDIDQWADSRAPKALADVFEALVGAIFLDSGYSLETVWKIIEPLLRQYINRSIVHPNLNPIRSFFEHQGKIIEESNDGKGNFNCSVQLSGGTAFEGHGKSKKLARERACRKATN